MTTIDPEKARDVFKSAFPFTEKTTKKMAVYRTGNGREIALQRERSESFYVWLEKYDNQIPGVFIKNSKVPGQPYGQQQARSSNLNDKTAPRLKVGNKVWYLEVQGLSELRQLVDWYQTV